MRDLGTRHGASMACAVLLALFLPLAMVSSWALERVSSTDQWVATLHPVASNPVVTGYLASEGAATVIRDLHVQKRVATALPPGVRILAPTLTSALQRTIASAIATQLNSRAFTHLWDVENRLTHRAALALLDGRVNAELARTRSIVIDLTPSVLATLTALDAQGVTFAGSLQQQINHHVALGLQILDARELRQAQRYYHLATSLAWLFPSLSVLTAVGVVLTSRPRRRGWARLGLVTLGASLVTYAAIRVAITTAAHVAPTPPAVTVAILNTLTSGLRVQLAWVTLAGAVVTATAWLAGSSTTARAIRHEGGRAKRVIERSLGRDAPRALDSDRRQWLVTRRRRIEGALRSVNVVVAAVASLILWSSVTTWGELRLLLVVVAIWYAVAFGLRRRLHRGPVVDAPPPVSPPTSSLPLAVESSAPQDAP